MINETEKIHSIFNQIMNAHGDELTPVVEITPSGNQRTVYYVDNTAISTHIAHEINIQLKNAGLYDKWFATVCPVARRKPEMGLLLEVTTHFNDGCPECCNDSAIFKSTPPAFKSTPPAPPVPMVKKLTMCGDSLVINVTKEVKALGLTRGDYVTVTIQLFTDHA